MKVKLLFLLFAVSAIGNSQIVNIPDSNFKLMLLATSPDYHTARDLNGYFIAVDTNNDNEIQVSEALQVGQLDLKLLNISDLTGIEAFTNLTILNCSENFLTALDVSALTNLQKLYCAKNQITSLDVSNLANLWFLECNLNQMTELDVSGATSLQYLQCNDNAIGVLDVSNLINLRNLECSMNNISVLDVTNHTNLEYLNCSGNQISVLNTANLTDLNKLTCSENQITELNLGALTELTELRISANLLEEIDLSVLTSLKLLSCANNQLTALNISGLPNLEFMSCSENPFTEMNLTDLPAMDWLYCNNNQLQSLDLSGLDKLSMVSISNSPITTVNVKNGRSETFNFEGCPNLQYICADTGQVNSIQSKINQYGYTNCFVNSYCTFVPGGSFYTVAGTIKWDQDANGCDAGDSIYGHSEIVIDNGVTPISWFAMNGNYTSMMQQGTYTVTPVVSDYFSAAPSSATVTFPQAASPFVQDFCIAAEGIHHDLEVTILPLGAAIPGFNASYLIIYKNSGTEIESGSVNLEFQGQFMDMVSSSIPFADEDENSVSWNFSGLNPFESKTIVISFNLNSPMETPALNSGDMLTFTASAEVEGEETPGDNEMTLRQDVINSLDPNDITCLEGRNVPEAQIGNYVHYLIRFENNGTANAQNIVINDILPWQSFEIASVVPVYASHPFQMTSNHASHRMEIFFNNINLPFDDSNNDGYIVFKVKLKSSLITGDTFSNSAKIFFDFNFPIDTNEYVTTIGSLNVNEYQEQLAFYPNPFTEVIHFDPGFSGDTIDIYDLSGRRLKSLAIEGNQVDLRELSSGNYIGRIIFGENIHTIKIVKE